MEWQNSKNYEKSVQSNGFQRGNKFKIKKNGLKFEKICQNVKKCEKWQKDTIYSCKFEKIWKVIFFKFTLNFSYISGRNLQKFWRSFFFYLWWAFPVVIWKNNEKCKNHSQKS